MYRFIKKYSNVQKASCAKMFNTLFSRALLCARFLISCTLLPSCYRYGFSFHVRFQLVVIFQMRQTFVLWKIWPLIRVNDILNIIVVTSLVKRSVCCMCTYNFHWHSLLIYDVILIVLSKPLFRNLFCHSFKYDISFVV